MSQNSSKIIQLYTLGSYLKRKKTQNIGDKQGCEANNKCLPPDRDLWNIGRAVQWDSVHNKTETLLKLSLCLYPLMLGFSVMLCSEYSLATFQERVLFCLKVTGKVFFWPESYSFNFVTDHIHSV